MTNKQTSILHFDDVCFSYGQEEILHSITFTVHKGSFIGVVGPNGGGKTTLLRLALGLEKPQHGTIQLLGENPDVTRKNVGYVMQYLQYDDKFPLTVLDLVLLGLAGKRMIGFFSSRDKEAAKNTLKLVGLVGFENRSVAKLSGGQRQRALIAQALIADPPVLVLDEPTANIDSTGEEEINRLLRNLAGTRTIIMVSHNINTVLDCASHVLCVNRATTMNPLSELNPDIIEKAKGAGIAVLHHELNCKVFDRTHSTCDID